MKKIIIIGASGHARVVIDIIERLKSYTIVGLIDSFKPVGVNIFNYKVLGDEEFIPYLVEKEEVTEAVIAIGDNWIRNEMYKKVKNLSPTLNFPEIIHPSVIIGKKAVIGKGTIIVAGTIINANAKIGNFCILNTRSSLGHDCRMKDFSSLAPGATIGGSVEIDEFSAISMGATIIQNIAVGKHTVVGAGAVVTKDLGSYILAYGVPAKEIRERKKGDTYLTATKREECVLTVHSLTTQEDFEDYTQQLNSLNINNPFYSKELLNVSNTPGSTLKYFKFSTPNQVKVIMPFYLTEIKIDNILTPYFDVISPYGYSGPLFSKSVKKDIKTRFWELVDQWYFENNVVSEFMRFSLNKNYKEYTGKLISTLNNVRGTILEDEEQQWSNFIPKVRNNYRKAQQEGLQAEILYENITDATITSFYNIYISTMERNKAEQRYFHSMAYFKSFIHANSGQCALAIIYKEGIAISAELILIYKKTLYSFLGGTMADYFYCRPNDFLKMSVMKWARQNNIKYYILGGGRVNDDGLYKYKKSFFTKDEDVVYYTGRKIVNYTVYKELVNKKQGNTDEEILNKIDAQTFFPLYKKPD